MEIEEMYLKLGIVLTGIIEADSIIAKKQKEGLKHLLQTHLKVKQELLDPKGRIRIYDVRIIFPQITQATIASAFDSCSEFIEKNQEAFNETMKKISLQIIEELSLIYLGTTKTEKILLNKLKNRLKKIKVNKYVENF